MVTEQLFHKSKREKQVVESVTPINSALGLCSVAHSNCSLQEGLTAFSLKTEGRKKQKNFIKDNMSLLESVVQGYFYGTSQLYPDLPAS